MSHLCFFFPCIQEGYVLVAAGAQVFHLQPIKLQIKKSDDYWISSVSQSKGDNQVSLARAHFSDILNPQSPHPFGRTILEFSEYFNAKYTLPPDQEFDGKMMIKQSVCSYFLSDFLYA